MDVENECRLFQRPATRSFLLPPLLELDISRFLTQAVVYGIKWKRRLEAGNSIRHQQTQLSCLENIL